MTLKERCAQMLRELGTPVTVFCRKVNISRSAYYAWQLDTLDLSNSTLERIDNYLTKYGF